MNTHTIYINGFYYLLGHAIIIRSRIVYRLYRENASALMGKMTHNPYFSVVRRTIKYNIKPPLIPVRFRTSSLPLQPPSVVYTSWPRSFNENMSFSGTGKDANPLTIGLDGSLEINLTLIAPIATRRADRRYSANRRRYRLDFKEATGMNVIASAARCAISRTTQQYHKS